MSKNKKKRKFDFPEGAVLKYKLFPYEKKSRVGVVILLVDRIYLVDGKEGELFLSEEIENNNTFWKTVRVTDNIKKKENEDGKQI